MWLYSSGQTEGAASVILMRRVSIRILYYIMLDISRICKCIMLYIEYLMSKMNVRIVEMYIWCYLIT